METIKTLEKLSFNPCVFFLGTDEEQAEAERQEAARLEEIKNIITAPDFLALQYTADKLTYIFTVSTHPGAAFSLSVFYNDNALSHTEYTADYKSRSENKTIFQEITTATIHNTLTLEILTEGEKTA